MTKAVDQRLQSVEQAVAQIANLLRLLIVLAVGLGLLLACQLFRAPAGAARPAPAAVADEPAERPAPANEQTKGRLDQVRSGREAEAGAGLESALKPMRDQLTDCVTELGHLRTDVAGLRSVLVGTSVAQRQDGDAAGQPSREEPLVPRAAQASGFTRAPAATTADAPDRTTVPSRQAVPPASLGAAQRAADSRPRDERGGSAGTPPPPRPQPSELPPAPAAGNDPLRQVLAGIVALARGPEPPPPAVAVELLLEVPNRVKCHLSNGQEGELTPGLMRDLDRALYEPLPAERLGQLVSVPAATLAQLAEYLDRLRADCVAELSGSQLKRIIAAPSDALVPDRIEENRRRERKLTDRRELDGKVAAVAPGDGGWALAGRVIKPVAAQIYEYRPPE